MLNFQVLRGPGHREEVDLVFLDPSNCLLLLLSSLFQCLTLFPQILILPFRNRIILSFLNLMSAVIRYLPLEIIIIKCLSWRRHYSDHWICLS